MNKQTRDQFEAAIITRFKESGFLEVEIRVECLQRAGGGYQDSQVSIAWWAWQAQAALDKAVSPVKRCGVCGLIESGTAHRIRGFMLNNGGFMSLDQLSAFEAKDAQPRKVTP